MIQELVGQEDCLKQSCTYKLVSQLPPSDYHTGFTFLFAYPISKHRQELCFVFVLPVTISLITRLVNQTFT